MPLYLEWAPLGVFSAEPEQKATGKTNTDNRAKEDKVSCVFQFFCTSGVSLYDLAVTICQNIWFVKHIHSLIEISEVEKGVSLTVWGSEDDQQQTITAKY